MPASGIQPDIVAFAYERMLARNVISRSFFSGEAHRLAAVSEAMARRFLVGGRILAFGTGPSATDAQHVAVEFVHPVIVGKRALPALDLSAGYERALPVLVAPHDMVMGFGPPGGDPAVQRALSRVRDAGAFTIALPGDAGDYAVPAPSSDPFISQEIFEILYHTLWETVHVFFEHREQGHDIGASAFLYPFLSKESQDTSSTVDEVAASIRHKAGEDEILRTQVADAHAETLARAVPAIRERIDAGGKLIAFGNGGSATDANDFVLDCLQPPVEGSPIPAISLAAEPANLSAIANDIGVDTIFLRQLIAHARPADVAVAISTSGHSKNVVAALSEARKRKLLTVAFLGYDGGDIARSGLADFAFVVPSDYIPRIQEVQASLYHTLLEALFLSR